MRPLALDLCCGAGGASMGLYLAGFDVIGIDIRPQPRYSFTFVLADALRPPFRLSNFDFIWASPVCKRYTRCWRGQPHRREDYPDQIAPMRALLAATNVPFVLENVVGSPLRPDLVLTGAMFDLPIVRDRVFEISGFPAPFALAPQHRGTTRAGDLAMIAGRGGAMKGWNRKNWDIPEIRAKLAKRNSAAGWREAMGINWMTRDELSQAIPPAYAEFVGRAALAHLGEAAA